MTTFRWAAATAVMTMLGVREARGQVGIAARLESGSPLSLGVPVLVHRGGLVVEPVLVFDRLSTRIEDDSVSGAAGTPIIQQSRTTAVRFGVGAYLRGSGAVSVYGGPRVGWAREGVWFDARLTGSATGTFRQEGSLSGLWYGALLGAEAAVAPRFAVGAELHWYSESLEGDIDEVNSFGGSTQSGTTRRSQRTSFTQIAVVVRWFPWRPLR